MKDAVILYIRVHIGRQKETNESINVCLQKRVHFPVCIYFPLKHLRSLRTFLTHVIHTGGISHNKNRTNCIPLLDLSNKSMFISERLMKKFPSPSYPLSLSRLPLSWFIPGGLGNGLPAPPPPLQKVPEVVSQRQVFC